VLLFSSFLVLGGVGFVGAVSAYAYYSRDLPDPAILFNDLSFDAPTLVYDRTGQVQLATFGELNRSLVTFPEIPPEIIDATTAIEDKDFWKNPGFDLGGFFSATLDTLAGHPRGGSTITQQLVRARLLPDSATTGSVYDRKIREIIQSIRLTQEFPGVEGKQRIIAAYLNQNFYGNQSYGVKAAAKTYFGKELKDLTLAQMAILAAIPQSPTEYDLVRNALGQCTVTLAAGATCPAAKVKLVVPQTSPIVQRRNQVLLLMETRSTLSGTKHTIDQYQAAMNEPVVLASQVQPPWKAPQFVWQVRQELGDILCGAGSTGVCQKIDTGGYRVTTTLVWSMQRTVDKWVYVAARTPHLNNPRPTWTALKISRSDWSWLSGLRVWNIFNAAAGVLDYRTGQVLAVAGSAGYNLDGNAKFQPKFDVFNDGYRQPGSAIKPINYITGINEGTLTAATSFMHVVTNFGGTGSAAYTPEEDDHIERGPERLRPALQFSQNISSVKAGLKVGLAHEFSNFKNFGLEFLPGTAPVVSQSIGTLETHPADMLSAYGAIADGGVLLPRTTILAVTDTAGQVVYSATAPKGKRVASAQASYIITDILAGNTIPSINPIWGEWQILQAGRTRRPAAYKTGTTDNNKDVDAYGYLPPPTDPRAPALAVGVWMGNSDSTPSNTISIWSSAPLWSRILTEISQGLPIARFTRPAGIVNATVDAFSGLLPGPGTVATVKEIFVNGTVPTHHDNYHVAVDIDSATGKLWQDGCTGPMVTKEFLDFSKAEPAFPQWQTYTQEWAARAAKGVGVRGGPRNNVTSYFYSFNFHPFGASWGGSFAPTTVCSALPPVCGVGPPNPDPSAPPPTPCPTETPGPTGSPHGKPTPIPLPT